MVLQALGSKTRPRRKLLHLRDLLFDWPDFFRVVRVLLFFFRFQILLAGFALGEFGGALLAQLERATRSHTISANFALADGTDEALLAALFAKACAGGWWQDDHHEEDRQ